MSEIKYRAYSERPLYGLVLYGGKSTRMGKDKGQLAYHGTPQREYLYKLLENICQQVFISIRDEQQASLPAAFKFISDSDRYRGPFNGILSAHAMHPQAAWMVLACDLPLIDQATLEQLRDSRDPEKDATALATKKSRLPEPLAAIWEPSGLKKAEVYLSVSESSCPRKFLINSDTRLVYPQRDELLWNANSMDDFMEVRSQLASG
jgi:molybdopterin-guanine dinucleotide biosynthesis protein A